jgi:hypothetical protein
MTMKNRQLSGLNLHEGTLSSKRLPVLNKHPFAVILELRSEKPRLPDTTKVFSR